MNFKKSTPEECGISSKDVLNYISTLDSYGLATHGYIMARGDRIFAEGYYAPYTSESKHRMYSVSKSFIALAVGLAIEDGLLSLDDRIVDFFPEYEIDRTDENLSRATVRDHLSMRTSMLTEPDWWGKPDRAECYFKQKSRQIPGTNYSYDSAGSFLLAVIVEKLTGKPMLEYLKDKCLRELGFSEDAYCLLAPGGHSHADSGVMCSCRDLLVFARLMLSGGKINGKRYVSEDFVRAATSKITDNCRDGIPSPSCTDKGYGYLIWKTPRDGFAFVGMADQYAICDPETDFIFIMNSANHKSSDGSSRFLVMHEIYKSIIEKLGAPLEKNETALCSLRDYEKNLKLVHLPASVGCNIGEKINSATYILGQNAMGIKDVRFEFYGDSGTLFFTNAEGENRINFGMGYNKEGTFPGKRRMSKTASVYEEGSYACVASASWCEKNKLRISVRITDTFLGDINMVFGFVENEVSVSFTRHAQRILDDFEGFAIGKRLEDGLTKQNGSIKEKKMNVRRIAKIRYGQDGAIWKNELFRFDHKGVGLVYDLSEIKEGVTDAIEPKAEFFLDRTEELAPHSNAVFFGREFYADTDEYPILYSNVYNNFAKKDDKLLGVCLVYRLLREKNVYRTELLQMIEVGFTEDAELWKVSPEEHGVRPYGNFLIDRETGDYYAFVMRNEELGTRYFRFKAPAVRGGVPDGRFGIKKVTLTKGDIIDYFDCPHHNYIQGAALHGGKIYSAEGFSNDPLAHPALRIIDLEKREQGAFIDLLDMGFAKEAEMIDFYGDVCYYSDVDGNLFAVEF